PREPVESDSQMARTAGSLAQTGALVRVIEIRPAKADDRRCWVEHRHGGHHRPGNNVHHRNSPVETVPYIQTTSRTIERHAGRAFAQGDDIRASDSLSLGVNDDEI